MEIIIYALGYITAALIALVVLIFIYYILKGLVVGIDLMRWQLLGADWAKIRATKYWVFKLGRMLLNCWRECIGDDYATYSRGSKTWSGYGTGR